MILNKNKINKRRLGKKKVIELIESQAILDEDLTNEFTLLNDPDLGRPIIYRLDGNILYVHGCDLIAGKGDVFSLVEINLVLQGYRSRKEINAKIANLAANRSGTIRWDIFSHYGSEMIDHIPELLNNLSTYLDEPFSSLDKSYVSLDLISEKINEGNLFDNVVNNYDPIFVYIGEIFKEKSMGEWKLSDYERIPYIDIGYPKVQYNPINVTGQLLSETRPADVRRLTVNEYRRFSKRLKYEKGK